ncbi:MAG: Yip1 family protein [Gammaproteobacteria bacterium]|jgi:hypothetical protein
MLSHIFGLFINPRKEWQLIHDSACSVTKCYLSYVLILAAIPPISGYFGTTLFGWQFGARDPVKLTSESALTIAIAYYMVMLVGVFTIGAMIQWMGKTYGAEQPLSRTVTLAAYTATPLFLVGIFELMPILWVNFLVGLPALGYTVVLLYTGLPIMMGISEEKGFLFSSAVLAVGLVALVCMMVATAILWGYGFAPQFID